MKIFNALFMVLFLIGCGGGGSEGSDIDIFVDNFQGNWTTQDNTLKISINKAGGQFNVVRIAPSTPGLSYLASLDGNILHVTTIINQVVSGTANFSLISTNTAKVLVTSCTPPAGYTCAAPGTELNLYKE